MRKVALGTLAAVSAGQAAPKQNEFSDSGIPFVRAGSLEDLLSGKDEADLELVPAEIAKKRKLKLYSKGSILFAKSGMSATKDRIYVLQNYAHVVSHLAIITPEDNVHAEYLRFALKQFPPSILIKDPAYPAIGLGEIQDYKIPVPEELDDQKRIAYLLGKVEGLIARRKQHLQQLDDLLKSVFLEMFGDPVRNEKNYNISTLAPYITHLTSGGRGWAKYYSESGKRFIRSLDVQMNAIGSDDIVYVTPPNNKETERTRVIPGDVLLTITGSKIGRVCSVPQDFEEAYISQHVAIIRTKGINPVYLSFYLSMPACGQRTIAKQQYGQAKPGLNLTQIQNFEIIVPDIDLQNQFAAIVEKVGGLKSRYQQSLTDLESLYGALSQKAFKGELDLSRVVLPAELTTEDTESTETHRPSKPLTQGFARQLLAAEILHRHNVHNLTQMKLQKLIHLAEHHAELDEIQGEYQRQAAGPYDNKMMYGIASSLKKQRWFETSGRGQNATYSPLANAGCHEKYLAHWRGKMVKVDEVLGLLGHASPAQCEIASTLYAAWNDLLIDGEEITDERIIEQASKAELWHMTKEAIDPARWPKALQWMRDHDLVPTGYGKHTRKLK